MLGSAFELSASSEGCGIPVKMEKRVQFMLSLSFIQRSHCKNYMYSCSLDLGKSVDWETTSAGWVLPGKVFCGETGSISVGESSESLVDVVLVTLGCNVTSKMEPFFFPFF